MINTTAIVSAYGTLQFFNTLAKLLEIPVAALAELKKPAKVIATWIVDKKLVGWSSNFSTNLAFLFPSSLNRWILLLLTETIAISLAAK